MQNIAIVCNCSTDMHLYYFLPSYLKSQPSERHDLIIIHNNYAFINKEQIINENGKVIYVNKILENGQEVPHRGTGSYKYVYNLYKNEYSIFGFLFEHTSFRRQHWLKDALTVLNFHDKIGFCASQIFNGNELCDELRTKYPHITHIRSPGPIFIKTEYLNKIDWNMKNDHDGEMILGKELCEKGNCVGIQIGNKINFAFDTLGFPPLIGDERAENRSNYNHITHLLEQAHFNSKKGIDFYKEDEYYFFENKFKISTDAEKINEVIIHPAQHLGKLNVFYDIQPFNNLIYGESVGLALTLFDKKLVRYGNCFCLPVI